MPPRHPQPRRSLGQGNAGFSPARFNMDTNARFAPEVEWNLWPAPFASLIFVCSEQSGATYAVSWANPRPRWISARPAPHNVDGTMCRSTRRAFRTPILCARLPNRSVPFIGQRNHDDIIAHAAVHHRLQPLPDLRVAVRQERQGSPGAVDEQCTQIDVTALRDAEQPLLSTRCVLTWNKTYGFNGKLRFLPVERHPDRHIAARRPDPIMDFMNEAKKWLKSRAPERGEGFRQRHHGLGCLKCQRYRH